MEEMTMWAQPCRVPGSMDNPFVNEEVRVRRALLAANQTVAALTAEADELRADQRKLWGHLRQSQAQFWQLAGYYEEMKATAGKWQDETKRLADEMSKLRGQRARAYILLILVSVSAAIGLVTVLLIQ